jgi:HK97 family phage major capsid protein
MATILELKEQRAKLVADARKLNDKVETEKRNMSAEEQTQFDAHLKDAEELRGKIDQQEKLEKAEAELAAVNQRKTDPSAEPRSQQKQPENDAEMRSFNRFISAGVEKLSGDERRALQVDNDTGGGYITAPKAFVTQLLKDIDNVVFIRQLGTSNTVNYGQSLGVPYLKTDLNDADWTPEIKTVTEDTALTLGKRELKTSQLTKLVKVSNALIRAGVIDPEALIRQRLAYKFGVTLEKAYMTGSGASQPLGLFTASDDGISTSRDVSTGNTTTAITFDGLKEAKYTLKAGYLPGAVWVFHRDAIKMLAKIKDGDGKYIWQPSVAGSVGDMLDSLPVKISEYCPNTFSSGNYVGLLGDLKYYWYADSLAMQIQRLVELYALTNQTGFVGRAESDGMPVLEEAFIRVKLA